MVSSGLPLVYIAHRIDADGRQAYGARLRGLAECVVAADLAPPDRQQRLAQAEVLATFSPAHELGESELQQVSHLSLVQCLAAGRDRFPFERFQGPAVAFNPGAAAQPIAEHALALVLAAAKNLLPRHQQMAQGQFNQSEPNTRLAGKTAAVIGLGAIGSRVATLLQALGVTVRAINRSGHASAAVALCRTLDGLGAVLDEADIVVVAIELNHATQGLIGRAELQRMRPDAILVNVSRAAVVQQDALYEHLRTHPQFRAGLDVWWYEPMHGGGFELAHPFFTLPNLIGSPHNSPMVPGIMTDLIDAASANIARHLRGEMVLHLSTSAM